MDAKMCCSRGQRSRRRDRGETEEECERQYDFVHMYVFVAVVCYADYRNVSMVNALRYCKAVLHALQPSSSQHSESYRHDGIIQTTRDSSGGPATVLAFT